jgi:hypothetical protein
MTALPGFLTVVMVTGFVALLVIAWFFEKKLSGDRASVQQFQASLAKHLPQDVQAEMMKIAQLGRVAGVAMIAVAYAILIIMFGVMETVRGTDVLITRMCRALMVVLFAAWTVSIARSWLNRRNPGEVLADLSPNLLAVAVRRGPGRLLAMVPFLFGAFMGFLWTGDWWVRASFPAGMLLVSLTKLMYSDRVWLAKRGLYLGGRLYPWDGLERIAWTDDDRAFALRRKGRWRPRLFNPIPLWTVVSVPEGSREAAEQALRQVMPAPTPAL